jgi:hypothetical protein
MVCGQEEGRLEDVRGDAGRACPLLKNEAGV